MKSGLFVVLALFCLSALLGIYFFGQLAVPVDVAALTKTATPLRIGAVDLDRIFAKLPATKEATARMNAHREVAAAEYQRLLKAGDSSAVTRYKKQRGDELQREAVRFRDGIVAAIKASVEALARRREFDLVFDSSAQGLSGTKVFLFTAPGFDLTDELLNDPELLAYKLEP